MDDVGAPNIDAVNCNELAIAVGTEDAREVPIPLEPVTDETAEGETDEVTARERDDPLDKLPVTEVCETDASDCTTLEMVAADTDVVAIPDVTDGIAEVEMEVEVPTSEIDDPLDKIPVDEETDVSEDCAPIERPARGIEVVPAPDIVDCADVAIAVEAEDTEGLVDVADVRDGPEVLEVEVDAAAEMDNGIDEGDSAAVLADDGITKVACTEPGVDVTSTVVNEDAVGVTVRRAEEV